MVCHSLEAVRVAAAELPANEGVGILAGMVEAYGPTNQAVLAVALGGGDPISFKVRLERPLMMAAALIANETH